MGVGELVPEFTEKEAVREHLAGVLHKEAQQVVFLGRQLHLLVVQPHDPSHQVDREVIHLEQRPLPLHRELMPQRRPQAGQQFVGAEWLGDVVVGTEIERRDLARLVAAA